MVTTSVGLKFKNYDILIFSGLISTRIFYAAAFFEIHNKIKS